MKTLLASIVLITFIWSCNSTVNTTTTTREKFKTHKKIAILPIEIIDIQPPRLAENYSDAELDELKKYLSNVLQKRFRSLLKDKEKRFPYTVSIQDAITTDAILQKNQYVLNDIFKSNKNQLAKLLGVDAVIYTRIITGVSKAESFNELTSPYIEIRLIIVDQLQQQPLLVFNEKKGIKKTAGVFSLSYATTPNERVLLYMSPTTDHLFNNFIKVFPYKK